MGIKIKKAFPKLKKSFKSLLTDESGKITKKDALGISAAAALIAGVEDVIAGYTTTTNPSGADPAPADADVPSNGSATREWIVLNGATCNHSSGVVNGHFSNIASANLSTETIEFTKTHANHSNHGSGGWC